ncbi:malate dehydrogenase, mitochondrial-like [Drosophila tropicalis]|uniref:malate dehydrogenase, mitochondrial-like n=1 Tax=Drosophila tropicalis TaxID=46794 RepID=UPI0035ABB613
MTVSLTAFEGDLDGLDTTGEVKSFVGPERLYESLTDAHIVIFAASMPRKPENAEEIAAITGAVSAVCPDALLVFATRPIDFVVPMAAEFLKKADNYDPRRLFGVTTLHSMRVRNIIAKILHVNPARVNVPVIGGFSVDTAMPVYSQCFPELREEMTDVDSLVEKINKSNYDGLLPKKIAVLTTPYAASRFIDSLLRGLNGEPDVVECSFVGYEAPLLPFFSNRVVLGPEGIQTNLGLPP